jgi:hypothetical protein
MMRLSSCPGLNSRVVLFYFIFAISSIERKSESLGLNGANFKKTLTLLSEHSNTEEEVEEEVPEKYHH